ncbi:MAG: hypothetical protein SO161_02265 [Treponema sp.]|nr:hypothetical protein [Treponema sp.]
MKKFLKLTTVVVSMVMALTFVSCANGNTSNNGNENSNENTSNNGNESSNENTSNNGNENSNEEELNLVGTYGVSKVEIIKKDSNGEVSMTKTMPTSTSIHQYVVTQVVIEGKWTTVEADYTVTKKANDYSFNWAKYNINGVAQDDDAKTQQEDQFNDDCWKEYTAPFDITYTTTADGKWNDNNTPASSGTYTVDEANSKVTITTLIDGGETLESPIIEEGTYSDNGKTFVIVKDLSPNEGTHKMTMTLTRK